MAAAETPPEEGPPAKETPAQETDWEAGPSEKAPPPPSRPEALRALAKAASPLLRGEEVRVCLAGPPGSGKSALLREFLPELHRAAAERGLDLPIYLVDGRPLGTAYLLLAALVRLAGGGAPATGWSWERLVEAWRSQVRGPAAVAVDHADEAEGAERLLHLLARHSPAPLGLLAVARSGSILARKWGSAIPVPLPGSTGLPLPHPFPLEDRVEAPPAGPGAAPCAQPGLPATPTAATAPTAAKAQGNPGAGGGVATAAPGGDLVAPEDLRAPTGRVETPLAGDGPGRPEEGRAPGAALHRSPVRPEVLPNSVLPIRSETPPTCSEAPPIRSETPPISSEALPTRSDAPLTRIRVLGDAPRLLLALLAREEGLATTGRLWRAYRRVAPDAGLRPLTLRRVSGLLRELEEAGLVSAPVLSRGRQGRTKWAALTREAREALRGTGGHLREAEAQKSHGAPSRPAPVGVASPAPVEGPARPDAPRAPGAP